MFLLGYNRCMKKISLRSGFTVLELLIIIAILCILLALVLVGLEGARKNSRNEKRMANVQAIALGLEQFRDACRFYPPNLDTGVTYGCLNNQTFALFVSDIDSYQVNQPDSEYSYVSLADASDPKTCIGYHLGVALEGDNASAAVGKAGFDSTTATTCDQNTGVPFKGSGDWFDLHK